MFYVPFFYCAGLFGQYQLEEIKPKQESSASGSEEGGVPVQTSRTQREKINKLRRKAKVVVDHVDIIKDEFWEKRPWILSNKPGKLPAEH